MIPVATHNKANQFKSLLLFLTITCEFYEHLLRNKRSTFFFISSPLPLLFLSSLIPIHSALIPVFLTASSLSSSLSLFPHSNPQSFPLMHVKARFYSVCHPFLITLSPTHKPIVHMGWLVREGLSIRGRGICYVLLLVAPWLQGHKGCLAAPGTEHHHYSLS